MATATLLHRAALTLAALLVWAGTALATPHAVPPDRADIARMVVEEAVAAGVSPDLALALAKVESNFNPSALSSAGARGVMQIMPATARGEFGVGADALWDARRNVQLGVAYLKQLLDFYGREEWALSHYNGGSRVGPPPYSRVIPETRGYVNSVLAWKRRYEGDGSASVFAAGLDMPQPSARVRLAQAPRAQTTPRIRVAAPRASGPEVLAVNTIGYAGGGGRWVSVAALTESLPRSGGIDRW